MLSRLAVAGTAVVAAVACGGGDGSEGLSRQEFIQEAEAICKRAQSESDALAEPQTDAEAIDFSEQTVSILERMITDLGELEPPSQLKADVEGWLALADRQATTGGDFIEALREQDEAPTGSGSRWASPSDSRRSSLATSRSFRLASSASSTTCPPLLALRPNRTRGSAGA